MIRLSDRLTQPGILVADGATGTMLQKAGLPRGMAPERWNLDNPEAIRALHRAYLEAGADIILTNTFGGNRARLQKHGLTERIHEINLAAAKLARQAAGENAFVFGDVGPLGVLLKPLGPLAYDSAIDFFAEQITGLAEGGVDAILVETLSDLNEAKAAVAAAKQAAPHLPVLVTFSFDTKGRTMMGVTPVQAAKAMRELGLAAVGANCGRTLSETLTAIEAMRQAIPEAVLMAKPNAGLPHAEGSDIVYDVTPQIMGEYALKFAALGVKIFGGCCGSTPEHIRAIAQALKAESGNP